MKVASNPWPIHDHTNANKADGPSCKVKHIRRLAVNAPAPKQGKDDEDSAISRINAAKMRWLQGRDHAIKKKNDAS